MTSTRRTLVSSIRRWSRLAVLGLIIAWALPSAAVAQPIGGPQGHAAVDAVVGPGLSFQLKASGLTEPLFVTGAPDGSARLFIVEQTGAVKILKGGVVLATPFLSLATTISHGQEQGLLGLAFHPQFATNHKLYVDYTDSYGDTIIREFRTSTTNPDVVDRGTSRIILKIDQPYANHNGGMLAFGPDGYLYIGMGDGGGAGDPGNRAQSTSSLLGKLLRIDVNGTSAGKAYRIPSSNPYVGRTGLDEIWDRGLRNPWRFSFDRSNGNLWIGDVGQSAWEEIDRGSRVAAGAGRALNWGWRLLEGRHCYNPPSGCSTSGISLPIVTYDHSNGRCAVTGGYVYRGSAIPSLVGTYLFGDYCSGEIWRISATAPNPTTPTLVTDTDWLISSFGQDASGELYVVDYGGGSVYEVVP